MSLKGQVVNALDVAGHKLSVAALPSPYCNEKAVPDAVQAKRCGRDTIKKHLRNQTWARTSLWVTAWSPLASMLAAVSL